MVIVCIRCGSLTWLYAIPAVIFVPKNTSTVTQNFLSLFLHFQMLDKFNAIEFVRKHQLILLEKMRRMWRSPKKKKKKKINKIIVSTWYWQKKNSVSLLNVDYLMMWMKRMCLVVYNTHCVYLCKAYPNMNSVDWRFVFSKWIFRGMKMNPQLWMNMCFVLLHSPSLALHPCVALVSPFAMVFILTR